MGQRGRVYGWTGSSRSPSLSNVDLDPVVERAIERCLETDPGERPRSVYEVLAALPGGDPLAAALAAGKTPSPELVANARSAREIRPRFVVLLALCVVGSLLAMAFANERWVRFPERSPADLSVIAEEIATRALGVSELPTYDAFGLMPSPRREDEGVRPYRLWRHWSPLPLKPLTPVPLVTQWRDLAPRSGGVTVVVDDHGFLVEASRELAPIPREPTAKADLVPLLDRAGIDPGSVLAEPVDPATLDPPPGVRCDQVIVWRDETSPEAIARADLYRGRIVAFRKIGHAPLPPPTAVEAPMPDVPLPVKYVLLFSSYLIPFLFLGVLVVTAGMALRNLRLGRGDRRGAFRAVIFTFVALALRESLSSDLDQNPLTQGFAFVFGRLGGAATKRAILAGIFYLAFEPIARRVWPRVLIGWARLVDGRLRDPRVGIEIVIGLAAGCGIALLRTILLDWGAERILADELERYDPAFFLHGPGASALVVLSKIGEMVFLTMTLVALIGAAYVAIRRALPALLAVALFLSLIAFGGGQYVYHLDPLPAAVHGVAFAALLMAAFLRGGLVAAAVYVCVGELLTLMPPSTDLAAWYAPYTIFTVAIILLVLAYGAAAALRSRDRSPAGLI